MIESDIEKHLVRRVNELGGVIRKAKWIGRRGCPDRVVMMNGRIVWIELKAPGRAKSFPSNPHEAQQKREHDRLRAQGQKVYVLDDCAEIDKLLRGMS